METDQFTNDIQQWIINITNTKIQPEFNKISPELITEVTQVLAKDKTQFNSDNEIYQKYHTKLHELVNEILNNDPELIKSLNLIFAKYLADTVMDQLATHLKNMTN